MIESKDAKNESEPLALKQISFSAEANLDNTSLEDGHISLKTEALGNSKAIQKPQ